MGVDYAIQEECPIHCRWGEGGCPQPPAATAFFTYGRYYEATVTVCRDHVASAIRESARTPKRTWLDSLLRVPKPEVPKLMIDWSVVKADSPGECDCGKDTMPSHKHHLRGRRRDTPVEFYTSGQQISVDEFRQF